MASSSQNLRLLDHSLHPMSSQVPVVDEREVLGVFSYRSFAKKAAHSTLDELNKEKCAPGDLTFFATARISLFSQVGPSCSC
jgi:hypothetical protein